MNVNKVRFTCSIYLEVELAKQRNTFAKVKKPLTKYRPCSNVESAAKRRYLSTNHRRRCNESTNLVLSCCSSILSMSLQGSPSNNSLVPLKVRDTLCFLDMAKIAL